MSNLIMSRTKIVIFSFILLITSIINTNSRVLVLPLHYASPNEPNQFEVNSIIDYYSKNDIYTSIKMGTPPMELEIYLDENDSGFYIKEGECKSDYKIKKSETFSSGEGVIYQYVNNELLIIQNNTNDKILLKEASKEYFYSSLNNRRFGNNLTSIEINNFSFLYLPNSDEIKEIDQKLNEKRMQQKKKGKENQKNDDINIISNNDNDKDDKKSKKNDDKNKKEKKNNGYGDDYYPDYYDFFGDEEKDEVEYSGFGPYYGGDSYDDSNPFDDVYSTNRICGHLSLLPPGPGNGLTNAKLNFIQQLKNKKIIDNYNWYIRFNKDKTGELVIGAAPHEIKPENYLETDLSMTHAILVNDIFYWQMKFSAVYMEDKNSNKRYNFKKSDGLIIMNENFIYATKDYFNNITEIYFEEYFDNNKCKIETISKTIDRYYVIYCHQNFTSDDIQKFPVLSFQSSDLNFIFTFDHNDLFLQTKNKYIFKIIYSRDYNYWKLGKIFLEKYQFVFNYDSKMFGFYRKFIPEKIEGDEIFKYDPSKKDKENDKLPPSIRKEIRDRKNVLNGEKEKDYVKIIIIIILVVLAGILLTYLLRRFIFNKQVNSKSIENYGKFKPSKNKNKILRLTEEYQSGEVI